MIYVRRYTNTDKDEWDDFLKASRTSSILFFRDFMDYHRDRFEDHSLMVFNNNKLSAIFPASVKDSVLTSHGGLTFGGLVVSKTESCRKSMSYFSELLKYCAEDRINSILLKQPPAFYNGGGQDEIDYALFLCNAELTRVDTALAIDQRISPPAPYQERRWRSIKKGWKNKVSIEEESSFSSFWEDILIPNLRSRFGTDPVHSLAEISSLAEKLPGSIRQFSAYKDGVIVAGCTIFESENVAHAQYISANENGRTYGAIDLLFHHLITDVYASKPFFDFGIANENEGRKINSGLFDWKDGFGARVYAHRFYKIDPYSYSLIDKAIS